MSTKRQTLNARIRSIGLWRRHQAGETVRQLAKEFGLTERQVSQRLKTGERFADDSPRSTGSTGGEKGERT